MGGKRLTIHVFRREAALQEWMLQGPQGRGPVLGVVLEALDNQILDFVKDFRLVSLVITHLGLSDSHFQQLQGLQQLKHLVTGVSEELGPGEDLEEHASKRPHVHGRGWGWRSSVKGIPSIRIWIIQCFNSYVEADWGGLEPGGLGPDPPRRHSAEVEAVAGHLGTGTLVSGASADDKSSSAGVLDEQVKIPLDLDPDGVLLAGVMVAKLELDEESGLITLDTSDDIESKLRLALEVHPDPLEKLP